MTLDQAVVSAKAKLSILSDLELQGGLFAIRTKLDQPVITEHERETLETVRSCIWDVMADRVIDQLDLIDDAKPN